MILFLGDIAFYMGTLVFAVGIYMLHLAKNDDLGKSKLLRSGGYVVTAIALVGLLCTGFYWFKYFGDGSYKTSSAHSIQHGIKGEMMNQCLSQIPEGAKMDEAVRETIKTCAQNQAFGQAGGSGDFHEDHEPHK